MDARTGDFSSHVGIRQCKKKLKKTTQNRHVRINLWFFYRRSPSIWVYRTKVFSGDLHCIYMSLKLLCILVSLGVFLLDTRSTFVTSMVWEPVLKTWGKLQVHLISKKYVCVYSHSLSWQCLLNQISSVDWLIGRRLVASLAPARGFSRIQQYHCD